MNMNGPVSLEEDQLDEKLKGLRIDIKNISKVIADTLNKKEEDIVKDMRDRITLDSKQGKEYGLVQEINSELFPEGADVISIRFNSSPQPQNIPQRV